MRIRAAKTRFGRLLSFAFAGASGFVVDVGVLWLLLHVSPLGPFYARAISIACAMTWNFLINRTFTFGKSDRPLMEEGVLYFSVGAAGAGLNYVIYAGLLLTIPALSPFLATFIAVAAVAVFSYFGYSRLVFQRA